MKKHTSDYQILEYVKSNIWIKVLLVALNKLIIMLIKILK